LNGQGDAFVACDRGSLLLFVVSAEIVALRPFAWLICRLATADCTRQPWRCVQADTSESES
jgi:hypothetical protein